MPANDPVFTPELIRIVKIFFLSAFGLVLFLSFFNGYRANNSGEDKTFKVADSDRLYFLNVRGIHYDREFRKEAGMTLFRHNKWLYEKNTPNFLPIIILNPLKDEAYLYFELENASYPIQLELVDNGHSEWIEFNDGNNLDHFTLIQKLVPYSEENRWVNLKTETDIFSLWKTDQEKEIFKTISEDYFRLINNPISSGK